MKNYKGAETFANVAGTIVFVLFIILMASITFSTQEGTMKNDKYAPIRKTDNK